MRALTLAVAVTLAAGACKKAPRYSPNCRRAAALTAPWDQLGLPIAGGRVCSSDASRAELQFLTGDRPAWEARFAEAMTTAGYAKDRCSAQSCSFVRDGARASVQVIASSRWVTVIVRR
jgi:hypothetical protein